MTIEWGEEGETSVLVDEDMGGGKDSSRWCRNKRIQPIKHTEEGLRGGANVTAPSIFKWVINSDILNVC